MLRHKFFSLLDGYIASEEECRTLLDAPIEKKTASRLGPKYGKHNMAKGAQRPEDAAVSDCTNIAEIIIFNFVTPEGDEIAKEAR